MFYAPAADPSPRRPRPTASTHPTAPSRGVLHHQGGSPQDVREVPHNPRPVRWAKHNARSCARSRPAGAIRGVSLAYANALLAYSIFSAVCARCSSPPARRRRRAERRRPRPTTARDARDGGVIQPTVLSRVRVGSPSRADGPDVRMFGCTDVRTGPRMTRQKNRDDGPARRAREPLARFPLFL